MTNTNERSGGFGDSEKLENTTIIKNFPKSCLKSERSFIERISYNKQGGKIIIEQGSNHLTTAR